MASRKKPVATAPPTASPLQADLAQKKAIQTGGLEKAAPPRKQLELNEKAARDGGARQKSMIVKLDASMESSRVEIGVGSKRTGAQAIGEELDDVFLRRTKQAHTASRTVPSAVEHTDIDCDAQNRGMNHAAKHRKHHKRNTPDASPKDESKAGHITISPAAKAEADYSADKTPPSFSARTSKLPIIIPTSADGDHVDDEAVHIEKKQNLDEIVDKLVKDAVRQMHTHTIEIPELDESEHEDYHEELNESREGSGQQEQERSQHSESIAQDNRLV